MNQLAMHSFAAATTSRRSESSSFLSATAPVAAAPSNRHPSYTTSIGKRGSYTTVEEEQVQEDDRTRSEESRKRARLDCSLRSRGCQFTDLYASSFLHSLDPYIQQHQQYIHQPHFTSPSSYFPSYSSPAVSENKAFQLYIPTSSTSSASSTPYEQPISPPLVSFTSRPPSIDSMPFDLLHYVNLSPEDFSPSASPSLSLASSSTTPAIVDSESERLYWQDALQDGKVAKEEANEKASRAKKESSVNLILSPIPTYPTPSPDSDSRNALFEHVLGWQEAR